MMNSPTNKQPTSNQKIAKAAGTMMAAYIFVSVVTLLRNTVILRTFGTSLELDAFYAANRIADFLFTMIAGGALASAFVPTFTGLLTQNKKKAAWKLASAVINWVLIIAASLSLLAAAFAPQIIRYVLAPDFAQNAYQFQITIQMMHITLISVAIFAVSGLVMGILNAHQSFLFPALAPAFYSIGQILGVVFLVPLMGIFGLAWGVVIGAGLHLLIQLPKLLKLNGQYALELGLKDEHVREVGLLMLPRLLGVSIVQINFIINTNLATRYEEGSLVGLQSGFWLMLLPLNFIAQAIATASLPTFSEQYALGKMQEMRDSFSSAMRSILLLSIPASMGLIVLRLPIIRFLFENETFNERSTQLVAWALLWYAVGLVGHSLLEIVVRAFYAQHDTKTPVTIGVAAMGLNILLSITLAAGFARIGWMPHGGLALANSIATAIEVSVLLWLLRKRLHGLGGAKILALTWRSLIAVVLMGAAVMLFLRFGAGLPDLLQLVGGLVLGVLVYGGMAFLLRIKELETVIHLVKRKLPGRLRG